MMRALVPLIIASTILLILMVPVSSGEVSIFNDHFSPSEPGSGDIIEIFVTVRDTNGIGINNVSCMIGNDTIEMEIFTFPEQYELNWSQGVLYSCSWEVKGGQHNYSFIVMDGSGNSTVKISQVLIFEIEEDKVDTIFGLPKTYCAISVIFITLMIIFLTWSYFKGRKMQKEMVQSTGSSLISCSACGAGISPTDESCPKCGAQFDEEEHVCGNCGEVISADDEKCSKCGTRLKTASPDARFIPMEKKDPDLDKLGKGINMKGKVKCSNCGSVYLKKEGSCPECEEE